MNGVKEDGLTFLLNCWVNGAIRSHAYIMGAKHIKPFIKGVSEVVMETFLEVTNGKNDVIKDANDPISAIKAYADLETSSGILSEGHTSIEGESDEIYVTFTDCPYAKPCSEILGELITGGQLDKARFPCIRADVSLAAAKHNSEKNGTYSLIQYAPGEKCKASLKLLQ